MMRQPQQGERASGGEGRRGDGDQRPEEQRPRCIVGLGEVVWDLFPDGPRLGGAPANVVYHLSALGDHGVLASRVGDDDLGRRALDELGRRGVDVAAVQIDPVRATGTVRVSFDVAGEPRFGIAGDAAWSAPEWTRDWQASLSRADTLCFGSLLQASPAGRAVLAAAVEALPAGALRLLDLNLRPPFDTPGAIEAALAAASAVKLSEAEVVALARHAGIDHAEVVPWLLQERGMRAVAVTRGARGSSVQLRDGDRDERPATPLTPLAGEVADAVGAGDAFTAALLHQLVRGHTAARCNVAASRYAAHVASRAGAMPALPEELRQQVVGEPGQLDQRSRDR